MAQSSAPAAKQGIRISGNRRSAQRGNISRSIHWPRTLSAKKQAALQREHLRFKTRTESAGVLHCFLLDCSGSMLAANQLALAQGALRHLHQRAYQQRAQIALITYAGKTASVRVPPTTARPFNSRTVDALAINAWPNAMQAGGGTPFAQGIAAAATLLAAHKQRNPAQQCWLWLLSDGRSNELPPCPMHADVVQIVDCEQQRVALNRCQLIAETWQAGYQTLNELLTRQQDRRRILEI